VSLVPHLWRRRIEVQGECRRDEFATLFGRKRRGGGRRWGKWYCDLKRLTTEQHGGDVRFTTMFDLYGLPKDFPGLCEHASDRDTSRRATRLEETMAAAVDDWRLVPYLQRHEFEALVLAGLPALGRFAAGQGRPRRTGRDSNYDRSSPRLRTSTMVKTPHLQSGSKNTSLAIERLFTGHWLWRKPGSRALRSKCPRFDAWIAKLEALGGQPWTTITDVFDLPKPQDIRAMGFVVKLREAEPGSDEVRQLVDDYVITPIMRGAASHPGRCETGLRPG